MRIKVVYKMTEKFARNRGVPAERDIAKRTYYLAEGRIRTLYHYPEGDVTRISKVRTKPGPLRVQSIGLPYRTVHFVYVHIFEWCALEGKSKHSFFGCGNPTRPRNDQNGVVSLAKFLRQLPC